MRGVFFQKLRMKEQIGLLLLGFEGRSVAFRQRAPAPKEFYLFLAAARRLMLAVR